MYELFFNNEKIMQSTKLKPIINKINTEIIKLRGPVGYTRSWCPDTHTIIIDYGSHTKFFKITNKDKNIVKEWERQFIKE